MTNVRNRVMFITALVSAFALLCIYYTNRSITPSEILGKKVYFYAEETNTTGRYTKFIFSGICEEYTADGYVICSGKYLVLNDTGGGFQPRWFIGATSIDQALNSSREPVSLDACKNLSVSGSGPINKKPLNASITREYDELKCFIRLLDTGLPLRFGTRKTSYLQAKSRHNPTSCGSTMRLANLSSSTNKTGAP